MWYIGTPPRILPWITCFRQSKDHVLEVGTDLRDAKSICGSGHWLKGIDLKLLMWRMETNPLWVTFMGGLKGRRL